MKRLVLYMAVFTAAAAGAREGLRFPPEGRVDRRSQSGSVEIRLPFGTVTMPETETSPPRPHAETPARLKALTRGVFRLKYRLVRDETGVGARGVRVTVDQSQEFIDAPTAKLREHEQVHQLINSREAARIQKKLAGFHTAGTDVAAAQTEIKSLFRQELKTIQRLHEEWDENHTFPSP